MVGIREAQDEKPKPETKKKTAVAMRDFLGESLTSALVILESNEINFLKKIVTGYELPVASFRGHQNREPETGNRFRLLQLLPFSCQTLLVCGSR